MIMDPLNSPGKSNTCRDNFNSLGKQNGPMSSFPIIALQNITTEPYIVYSIYIYIYICLKICNPGINIYKCSPD